MAEPIDPKHYTWRRIEPIDVIEAWELDFSLGSAIKYIARADASTRSAEDLLKASNYCFRAATGLWLPKEAIRLHLIEHGATE